MGQAFLHGNAGKNLIGFRVVVSAERPASPQEYTVWIQTSIPCDRVNFRSTTAPDWADTKGCVNIGYKATGSAPSSTNYVINLTKKDGIVHAVPGELLTCHQNQDGTSSGWKPLNAYVYKSGAWLHFSTTFSATIAVTYPAGSALTCTDGTTTLTASTTTGSYTFVVPNSGTWTVKAVSGSNSASQSVSITSSGQSESVTLSYRTYLFKNGDQCNSLTGGWTGEGGYAWGSSKMNPGSISGGVIGVTGSSSAVGVFGTWNKINFSAYKKLYVKASNGPSGSVGVRLVSGGNLTTSTIYASGETPQGTTVIDVSGVTASAYVAFYATNGYLGVTEVWLEK